MTNHNSLSVERFPLRQVAWILLGFVVLALVLFREVLLPGNLLLTTDDNIGALALRKAALPYSFFGGWDDSVLIGRPFTLNLTWTQFLLWALPLRLFSNWMHALDLVLASLFLVLFLRARGLSALACAFGGLVAMWVASNFTLTFAGHINKFAVLLFAALSLWLLEETAQRQRVGWGILAGAALGGMFLEQPDVALFFALIIFPYGIYALWRECGFRIKSFAILLLPCALVAILVGVRPLWEGYRENIQGVAEMEGDAQAKWDFVTQWSWPPEESIDFLMMGYTGWRTGEAVGPYWGRMGRSAGWEDSQRGFRNFKLENQYIGAIPLIMVVWACAVAWALRRRDRRFSGDVLFWAAASLVTLVLAFGKYTPVYRLFYMLPMVSSIRNPNKFLQIFQVALALVSAYGLDALAGRRAREASDALGSRGRRAWLIGLAAVAGVLLLWAAVAAGGTGKSMARFTAEGWGQLADTMARVRLKAVVWGAAMSVLAVAGVAVALRMIRTGQGKFLSLTAAALLGLVAIDAVVLSRHYIQVVDDALIRDNPVTQLLKESKSQRVYLPVQQGFYNAWLTYLFPYHDIDAFNITQMPRMPVDYQRLLAQVPKNPFKIWRLCGVDYLVGPGTIWNQIQATPQLKDQYALRMAFSVTPSGPASVTVHPASPQQQGDQVVLHSQAPALRYALVAGWETMEDDQALAHLSDPSPAFEKVAVAPEFAEHLPSATATGLLQTPIVVSYRPGRTQLRVTADRPALLRCADKYTPHWQARVDGVEVPVLRCDYMFTGVAVPPGLHEIELVHRPGFGSLWFQLAGLALALVALASLLLAHFRPVREAEAP